MQYNLAKYRSSLIEKNLRRTENLQVKWEISDLKSRYFIATKDKICPVCNKRINDPVFAFYPNGVVVHFKCATNKYVDPTTGRDFKVKPL